MVPFTRIFKEVDLTTTFPTKVLDKLALIFEGAAALVAAEATGTG
jgi:hypothetical protein